jgi:hypothetical protein
MRKPLLPLVALATALTCALPSCKETDAGVLPVVMFRSGPSPIVGKNFATKDTSMYDLDTCVIGIKAYKAETPDVLKKLTLVRSEAGRADTTVIDTMLTGTQGDTVYINHVFVVKPPLNTKQTFKVTVTNRDGLIGTKSLTVTTL